MQSRSFCRHYNGVGNGAVCKAGKTYAKLAPSGRHSTLDGHEFADLERLPCIKEHANPVSCPDVSYYTAEEVKEQERQAEERLRQWTTDLANNVCPSCHQAMTKRQVGRCVYARPCGHRLYQGTI